MKIKTVFNTTFKSLLADSTTLPDKDKVLVSDGKEFEIAWHREIDNHILFELRTPFNGRYNWYAYKPHVQLITDSVRLNVPYFSQRDNSIRPHQTCNMTCASMVIEYYYPGTNNKVSGQLEDTLTRNAVNKWGRDSIYSHNRIVDTLHEWKVNSSFSITTTVEKMKESLSNGNPVIYSGKFTRSGHIIVLTGFDDKGFLVNDPYGEWFPTGYVNTSGKDLHYSYKLIERVSYSGKKHGWAHLTSKIS